MLVIRALHLANGDTGRTEILIPDSAHGTNPASVVIAGMTPRTIKSRADGRIDLDALRAAVGPQTAGIMITNPNTLGLFENDIREVADIVHAAGGRLYMDGANLNAIMGKARPGDMGFDVVHLNLHKTFSTPHGGGGPGAGPICVTAELEPFLPGPRIAGDEQAGWTLETVPAGPDDLAIHSYFGNVGVCLRALPTSCATAATASSRVTECAVLNANYLLARLRDILPVPHADGLPARVRGQRQQLEAGVRGAHPGHRQAPARLRRPRADHLLPADRGRGLMVEPTETETRESLDQFVAVVRAIHREAAGRAGAAARRAPHHAGRPHGRGPRGPPAGPALARPLQLRLRRGHACASSSTVPAAAPPTWHGIAACWPPSVRATIPSCASTAGSRRR